MSHTFHMILFALMFMFIIGSLQYYIWRRLIRDTRLKQPYKQISTTIIILLFLSAPVTMIFSRTVSAAAARIYSFGPLLWLGAMLFVVTALLIIEILFLFRWIFRRKMNVTERPIDSSKRTSLKRIAAAGTIGLSGALTGISIFNAQKKASILRHTLSLEKFPSSLNGFKIAQISDLHLGLTIGGQWLQQVVRQVNRLEPDIIVITGDLVDGYINTLAAEVSSLNSLHAPYGVFFVTGNHEYYFKAPEWIDHLKKLGITVLQNEGLDIGHHGESFWLAGVNDYQGARNPNTQGPELPKALAHRQPNQEIVLLCHQPKIIFEAAQHDVGLVLSGHTHGGQIWPFQFLVRFQQPYIKGLITGHGRTLLYINQGTGYWGPPMRLGTQSEITLITLRNKG